MGVLRGSKDSGWHPAMTADTTTSTYWLNWRVLICGVYIAFLLVLSSGLVSRYEGFGKKRRAESDEEEEEEAVGTLYEDETWRPCLRGVHPAWLLGFRVVAFLVLLVLLIVTVFLDGGGTIFYYYTQWTFTLITFYFGLGSLLSIHGCYQHHKRASGDKVDNVELDSEQGNSIITDPEATKSSNDATRSLERDECDVRRPAGFWGYSFQIIFQMNAGAVLLTDCVFWFVIVPFLEINDYNLSVLDVNMHTVNAFFLLGDAALNSLRFPCFRIAYFFLWTVTYVIFQWILHASVKLWWPYPFLDLSSSFAPLWYVTVAALHIPCYGGFALLIKLKHYLLKRWFPESYRCAG